MNILFAPHEINGQMRLLAETLRRRGYFATSVAYGQDWLREVDDINFNFKRGQSRLGRAMKCLTFFLWASSVYDVFHFFYGESLIPFLYFDLPILKALKKKIVVHFRGSDVVNTAFFDYRRACVEGREMPPPPMSLPYQRRRLKMWQRYADTLLVSTPNLHSVVPNALLIQQAIDLSKWRPAPGRRRQPGDKTIVVHAPSWRRTKGTEYITQAVQTLQAEGQNVELRLIEYVPKSEVKALYEEADIGIDQLLHGWHGILSVELMALGKPVLCYIDEELAPYRPDLPIVSTRPQNLVEKLRFLIEDEALRSRLGEQGQAYVAKYHDVEKVVDSLIELYESL
jgi:glycosyltransferase involved in cell wall biosynthesis